MKTARHWRGQAEKTFSQLSPTLQALYEEVSTFQTFEDLRLFIEAFGQELESVINKFLVNQIRGYLKRTL